MNDECNECQSKCIVWQEWRDFGLSVCWERRMKNIFRKNMFLSNGKQTDCNGMGGWWWLEKQRGGLLQLDRT